MAPSVKNLCLIRHKSIRKGDNERLQNRINTLIRENMVTAVKNENRKNSSGLTTSRAFFVGDVIHLACGCLYNLLFLR